MPLVAPQRREFRRSECPWPSGRQRVVRVDDSLATAPIAVSVALFAVQHRPQSGIARRRCVVNQRRTKSTMEMPNAARLALRVRWTPGHRSMVSRSCDVGGSGVRAPGMRRHRLHVVLCLCVQGWSQMPSRPSPGLP